MTKTVFFFALTTDKIECDGNVIFQFLKTKPTSNFDKQNGKYHALVSRKTKQSVLKQFSVVMLVKVLFCCRCQETYHILAIRTVN